MVLMLRTEMRMISYKERLLLVWGWNTKEVNFSLKLRHQVLLDRFDLNIIRNLQIQMKPLTQTMLEIRKSIHL